MSTTELYEFFKDKLGRFSEPLQVFAHAYPEYRFAITGATVHEPSDCAGLCIDLEINTDEQADTIRSVGVQAIGGLIKAVHKSLADLHAIRRADVQLTLDRYSFTNLADAQCVEDAIERLEAAFEATTGHRWTELEPTEEAAS